MKLSIITVSLNDRKGLESTLNSIAKIPILYRRNFEHIIVDGMSRDGTIEYCKNYEKSPYVKTVFISEQDNGIYNAMNKGLRFTSGEFCVFINCGDLLVENIDFLLLFKVLTSNFQVADSAGIAFNVQMKSSSLTYMVKSRVLINWRLRMPTVHQGIIYKTNFLLNNSYDETLRICSDFKSIVTAVENNLFFEAINKDLAVLSLGGISTERPFLLIKESLGIVFRSKVSHIVKVVSSFLIFINVLVFQLFYRTTRMIKGFKCV
jgi:putative colanic acid biosynthesis glycosyltransferase